MFGRAGRAPLARDIIEYSSIVSHLLNFLSEKSATMTLRHKGTKEIRFFFVSSCRGVPFKGWCLCRKNYLRPMRFNFRQTFFDDVQRVIHLVAGDGQRRRKREDVAHRRLE